MESSDRRLVLLAPEDNCLVVARALSAGDALTIEGERIAVARGAATKSEALGHQEFILTYKAFEPAGPACLPVAA
jgi:altronate hydrolase